MRIIRIISIIIHIIIIIIYTRKKFDFLMEKIEESNILIILRNNSLELHN